MDLTEMPIQCTKNEKDRAYQGTVVSDAGFLKVSPVDGCQWSFHTKKRHDRDPSEERRRHRRFLARGDSFAMLKPHSNTVGQILDVSRGGLSFYYLPHGETSSPENEECDLHILLADHSFYFDSFPCRIVSDSHICKHEFGFSLLKMRRQSVAFLTLTEEHLAQLEYFTRNYTVVG